MRSATHTGREPEAILQEIYATIFVCNLRQLLINEAQLHVNQQIKESTRPHKYEQKQGCRPNK